jgi:hypothetical protein
MSPFPDEVKRSIPCPFKQVRRDCPPKCKFDHTKRFSDLCYCVYAYFIGPGCRNTNCHFSHTALNFLLPNEPSEKASVNTDSRHSSDESGTEVATTESTGSRHSEEPIAEVATGQEESKNDLFDR